MKLKRGTGCVLSVDIRFVITVISECALISIMISSVERENRGAAMGAYSLDQYLVKQ